MPPADFLLGVNEKPSREETGSAVLITLKMMLPLTILVVAFDFTILLSAFSSSRLNFSTSQGLLFDFVGILFCVAVAIAAGFAIPNVCP